MHKTCTSCNIEKPSSDFSQRGVRLDGKPKLVSWCKKCSSKIRKKRYDPKKKRERDLKKLFGITLDQYDNMLEEQKHMCAICNTTDTNFSNGKHFHVDHDHNTGKVRGLLCGKCNVALGLVGDNISTLQSMITYLSGWPFITYVL